MSLTVYHTKKEVPQSLTIVRNNDIFFEMNTNIPNTEVAHEILATVDKAKYVSEKTFEGRTKEWGALFKNYLSTGTKTLLNILSNPDKCFDIVECGNNALELLSRIKDGYVLWEYIVVFPDEEEISCDILYKGNHFTDFYEFLGFADKESRGLLDED